MGSLAQEIVALVDAGAQVDRAAARDAFVRLRDAVDRR